MFHSALKALLFCWAMLFVVDASRLKAKRDLVPEVSGQVDVQVSASVSPAVLVKGWASVSSALSVCQNIFQQDISTEVAIYVATEVSASIEAAASQYGQCACGGNGPSGLGYQVQFKSILAQFFLSFQAILKAGKSHFRGSWEKEFAPIFARCSSGFDALKSISASLEIDLNSFVSNLGLDLSLFLDLGLNLSVLLGINVSLGLNVAGLIQL